MGTKIKATLACFMLAGNIAAVDSAAAQNYPNKPIRLIVPFPPGGPTDIIGRPLAQKLTETFKQAVIVDNRPGANGNIGSETTVRASPDGYTLMLTSGVGYAASAALYKLPYDPVNDVTPIALLGESGAVVALHSSVPVMSIKELITYDKANPRKLNYGSSGNGSFSHLTIELFNQMAGAQMTHVPYKGAGLALNDLLGGQIQLFAGGMISAIPHIRSKRLRGIAITSAKRSSALPDIPTVSETVPGYESANWYAVLGPKALPKDIVARLNSEMDRILQLADVKARLVADGIDVEGGPPERLRGVLTRDVTKWQKVIKTANIKAEG